MKVAITGLLILFHVLMMSIAQLPDSKKSQDSFCGTSWTTNSAQKSSAAAPVLPEQEYLLLKAGFHMQTLLTSTVVVEKTQVDIDLHGKRLTALNLNSAYSRYYSPDMAVPLQPELNRISKPS